MIARPLKKLVKVLAISVADITNAGHEFNKFCANAERFRPLEFTNVLYKLQFQKQKFLSYKMNNILYSAQANTGW